MKHSRSHGGLAFLKEALDDLERRGELRVPATPRAADVLSFCSNDYLGLAALPPPPSPAGAGAARLLGGERVEHAALEVRLARFVGAESALLFTSGYAANVGAVSALAGPEDLVVSDTLNHASLIDGTRLSKAQVVVAPHLDVAAVEAALAAGRTRRAFVVVESYYSMDADGPDLAALRAACDRHGAVLMVDEAHALGILGPEGRGRLVEAGVHADVTVGTLGKSLGAQGAFVAGSPDLRRWLWNRARSFVFSTGVAPASAAAASRALDALDATPTLRLDVLARAEELRRGLEEIARRHGDAALAPVGFGHVVPVVLGDTPRTLRMAERLRAHGIEVHAVRPPTVPTGGARLRFTVTARHTPADVARALEAFADAVSA